jgi:hypothetical protein
MTPTKKSGANRGKTTALSGNSPEGDRFSMGGEVHRGGVVVQGADAHVEIKQIYRDLSPVEAERQLQLVELKELKQAITQKIMDLKEQVGKSWQSNNNPFHFLEPLGFNEGVFLFGRKPILQDVLERTDKDLTVFLGGNSGIGKTSLLQAGLIPALLAEGHLPLMVSVGSESLELSIKRQLLRNIEAMDFIKEMSLAEFLRRVSDELKEGKSLFIIVDRLEEFFDHQTIEQQQFKAEWRLCITGGAPDVHWLFSIHLGSSYLLALFQPEIQPFANLTVLSPLNREAAREAIIVPAQANGISVENLLLDELLDRLGGDSVDPAQLQLVCYTLAGGTGTLTTNWTVKYYESFGKVDGILRDYLEKVIERFPPEDREPAWMILACLSEERENQTSDSQLFSRLESTYRVKKDRAMKILEDLQLNHLVDLETHYRLASGSLRQRVQLWIQTRSASVQAREEVLNQVRSIGASALRGLIGGVIGFALAYLIMPYQETRDIGAIGSFLSLNFYTILLRALFGGIGGFVFILGLDISLAAFRNEKARFRYPAGMLAGGIGFAIILALHITVRYFDPDPLRAFLKATLTGLVWGMVAGAGAVWCKTSRRLTWLKLLAAGLVCGIALACTEYFMKSLGLIFVENSFMYVLLAGAVMPLFLIGFSLLGNRKSITGD